MLAKGDRLPRLLKMITTIQRKPGLSAQELASECGVGTRQLFRDLRVLDYAGLPIESHNGYRFITNVSLQNISFSLDEALSLLYGLKLMERQKALFPIQRVKERLLELLPKGLRDGIENLDPHVDMTPGPAADYSGKMELFRTLNQAMRESRQVVIDYYCFYRDDSDQRTVDPYHMAYKDGFWYLVGFCHLRGEKRLFRVDRIRHLQLAAERFEPPEEPLGDAGFGAAWGMEMGEEFQFQVRFWGDSARYVRETQFHPSQELQEEPEGAVVFTAKATGLKSVSRWVLQFGGEAEVLGPPELRERVVEAMGKGLERYR